MGLTYDTKTLIADFFATIAEKELKVEEERLKLVQETDFDSFKVFKRLDRFYSGEVNESDIISFFADNGVTCNHYDAKLIISQYSESNSGKLCFTEFNQIILPTTNETLRIMATTNNILPIDQRNCILPSSLEKAIACLFKAELDFQRKVDLIREDLNSRDDFDITDAFNLISNISPYKKINRKTIYKYVDQYLKPLTENELDAIIRRLDRDGDRFISFLELTDAVKGIINHSTQNFESKTNDVSYQKPSPSIKKDKIAHINRERLFKCSSQNEILPDPNNI